MDDATAMFYEDVSKKSIIARSSHNTNRNYNRNKYYTQKEIEKLSSETVTMNVNEYIPYKEFKKLPVAMQTEYIRSLSEKYQVTATAFAHLWGVDPSTACKVFRDLGVKAATKSGKNERKFLRDLKPKPEKKVKATVETEEVTVTPVEPPKPLSTDAVSVKSEALLYIDPGIVVDYAQIDTTIKFNTPEDICRFFMRYIPLGASMHLSFVIEKDINAQPIMAIENSTEKEVNEVV